MPASAPPPQSAAGQRGAARAVRAPASPRPGPVPRARRAVPGLSRTSRRDAQGGGDTAEARGRATRAKWQGGGTGWKTRIRAGAAPGRKLDCGPAGGEVAAPWTLRPAR
jgi:hypothetical protein